MFHLSTELQFRWTAKGTRRRKHPDRLQRHHRSRLCSRRPPRPGAGAEPDGEDPVANLTEEGIAPAATTGDRVRLLGLSFLMLFVELALIRWSGSNVLHLSYFSNFVLLGSFLGIGIGFLRGDQRRD